MYVYTYSCEKIAKNIAAIEVFIASLEQVKIAGMCDEMLFSF